MNPNRDLEHPAPHHDEMMLHHFGWYMLECPCYPLPSQALEISGREGARGEPWPRSPWSRSAAIALALVWLVAALAVMFFR